MRRRSIGCPCQKRSLGDFTSLMQVPDFASAWGSINAQLAREGASPLDVAAAQNDLAQSFETLTSSASGFGLSAQEALQAAQAYTVAGRTIGGAVDHVQHLVAAAQGGDPAAAFQTFTGTLIGAATAAGALSAGVGAVIVAGVGIGLDLLQSAGLFGSAPKGVQVCPGLYMDPPPSILVGCVGSDANVISNGAANWRHYPKRSGGNKNDQLWYSTSGTFVSFEWSGSPSGAMNNWSSYQTYRFIDSAFPDAHYLACMTVPPTLSSFGSAFVSAWTANKEFELNGLKSQPDWEVLLHLVRIWNRAHSGSSSTLLSFAPKPNLYTPTVKEIAAGRSLFGPLCPSNLPFYPATLVEDVMNNAPSSDPAFVGGSIRINTGPLITTRRVIPIRVPPAKVAGVYSAHPSRTTSGTTAAIVSALALATSAGVYLARRGRRPRASA